MKKATSELLRTATCLPSPGLPLPSPHKPRTPKHVCKDAHLHPKSAWRPFVNRPKRKAFPAWGKELLACFADGERMARAVTPLPLARSTQPWTFGPPGAAWYDALKYIAAHRDETTMPPDMLVDHDPYTYTICDGYAKAQYHFLILPRIPFYIDVQDQGISTRVQVPTRDLDSIQALLQSRHASAVLDRLGEARHRVRTNSQKAHR